MAAQPNTVVVAMSGGVDSSVAAALLADAGHHVVGLFMRLGSAAEQAGVGTCCSLGDAEDGRAVADRLGIDFYVLNCREDFERIIAEFCAEYTAGRTPNPCVRCNQWLKFSHLARYADALGDARIATGHYARIVDGPDGPQLHRGQDRRKDQSYVLFGIDRPTLSRVLLPLGDWTKEQVRRCAAERGLPVHDKAESQDVCFVPDGDYAKLLADRGVVLHPGPIRHVDGRRLGEHDGYERFTVGQRRGLRIAAGHPLYVVRIEPDTATVVVGEDEHLMTAAMTVTGVRWLTARPPTGPLRADVQIRYTHRAAAAEVVPVADGAVGVRFDAPQRAVTPGQAAVFYDGDRVLGGGWIEVVGR
jgi:tRNA-specific 2-thiouridylase